LCRLGRGQGEFVFVGAGRLNHHFVGEFAFARVHFPFAYEGIVRRPKRTGDETRNQHQLKNTI
jgi:hypothetical protein